MKKNLDFHFKLLSEEDLDKFGDFISSPYFNKLPRLTKVFQFIKKNYELVLKNKLTREDLSAFMYPGEPFKDSSIRKLISDFNKLIEKFAIQKELEADKVDYNLKLLKQLRKNRVEDKFDRLYKGIDLLNEEDRSEVDQYYENRMRLLCERFELMFHKSIKEKKDIFQKKSDMLDLEFVMKKIYLFEAMTSIRGVNKNISYHFTFFNEVDKYINSNKDFIMENEPELYRNYLQLRIQLTLDKNLLGELENIVYSKYAQKNILRPLIDLSNIYTYVGLRTPGLRSVYSRKNFEIYKYIEKNKLLSKFYINHINFVRAIQSGLSAKEFEWTKTFIDNYKNKIKPEFRDDVKNYSYGKLYYELKNYEKSLFYLTLVNFKDYYIYTNAKKMLLRTEYELGNNENVISQIESIQKFYNSHTEITDAYKIDTLNYILILNELAKLQLNSRNKSDKSFKKNKLLKNLEKNKNNIVYYNWLLEKITKLK